MVKGAFQVKSRGGSSFSIIFQQIFKNVAASDTWHLLPGRQAYHSAIPVPSVARDLSFLVGWKLISMLV